MLSFAFAVAGRFEASVFDAVDPTDATFYCELKPITDNVDAGALAVSGLDREALVRDGTDPSAAMSAAASWIGKQAGEARPVLVAYPVVFDWMFLHWYFIRFHGKSPFGFSSALDMKTMYQQTARVTLDRAGRTDLPPEFSSTRRHTHNALDDAVEQAEIFSRLFA
jgi:hypothetical protein